MLAISNFLKALLVAAVALVSVELAWQLAMTKRGKKDKDGSNDKTDKTIS